jgi:hypothetical protein
MRRRASTYPGGGRQVTLFLDFVEINSLAAAKGSATYQTEPLENCLSLASIYINRLSINRLSISGFGHSRYGILLLVKRIFNHIDLF